MNQRVSYFMRRVGFIFEQLEKKTMVAAFALIVIFGCVMGFVQRHATMLDPDGYYHAKMALLIMSQGVVRSFSWLPLTILSNAFTDQHFLYHVLLIPFVAFGSPLVGIKVSVVVLGVAAILVFFWMLKRLRVPGAFWWTVLYATNSLALFRLNLVKAYPVSLMLFCVGFVAIAEARAWWLAFILFVFVWTYGGWPLLLGTALIAAGWGLVLNHHEWRRALRVTCAAIGGAVAGFVINPYFPANIVFTERQTIAIALTPSRAFGIGTEWSPLPWPSTLNEQVPLVVLVVGVIALTAVYALARERVWFSDRRRRVVHATAALAALVLFVMTCLAERYAEYSVPLIILTLALSVAAWQESGMWSSLMASLKNARDEFPLVLRVLSVILGIVLVAYAGHTVYVLDQRQAIAQPIDWGERGARWMSQNLPPGTLIMNLNWGNFPELFFWNTTEHYAMGLDPRLLNDPGQKKFLAWQTLYEGTATDPIHVIANDFQSSYVVVNSDMTAAKRMMDASGARLLYTDRDMFIYGPAK